MNWEAMEVATERDKIFLYDEIILQDQYKLRKLDREHFDYIIDIGANVGYFSLFARDIFQDSKILAVEPIPETFDRLKRNTRGTGIAVFLAAIGDGRGLFIKRATNGEPVCDQCVSHATDQESIISITLFRLFKKFKIPFDSRYLIKFDCEGGEIYFDHEENFNILKNAAFITGEVHFDTIGTKEYPQKEKVMSLINKLEHFFTMDITISDHVGHICGVHKNGTLVDWSWIDQKEHESESSNKATLSSNPYENVDISCINQKGIDRFNKGYIEKAKDCFFEILRRAPNNKENLFNLSLVYLEEKNSFESIEYLLKILRQDPSDKKALLQLCKICDGEGILESIAPLIEKNLEKEEDIDLRAYSNKLSRVPDNLCRGGS